MLPSTIHDTDRIRTRLLPVTLLGLLITAPLVAEDAANAGVPKELKGMWKVVKLESQQPVPKDLADQLKLEFKDTTLVVHSDRDAKEFDVKFPKEDTKKAKQPAFFAMAEKEGPKKDQTGRVLYQLDKDGKLTVCVPNGPDKEDDPPITDFEMAKKSTRHLILVMEKVKTVTEAGDK